MRARHRCAARDGFGRRIWWPLRRHQPSPLSVRMQHVVCKCVPATDTVRAPNSGAGTQSAQATTSHCARSSEPQRSRHCVSGQRNDLALALTIIAPPPPIGAPEREWAFPGRRQQTNKRLHRSSAIIQRKFNFAHGSAAWGAGGPCVVCRRCQLAGPPPICSGASVQRLYWGRVWL